MTRITFCPRWWWNKQRIQNKRQFSSTKKHTISLFQMRQKVMLKPYYFPTNSICLELAGEHRQEVIYWPCLTNSKLRYVVCYTMRIWKHRTVQGHSRHEAISDWSSSIYAHHILKKKSRDLLTNLEPEIMFPRLERPYSMLSFLYASLKKISNIIVMNTSSNQSNKKKTLFTVRKNAQVAPGCKYKREKITRIEWFSPQTQQGNYLRGSQKYVNVIGCWMQRT